MSRLSLLLLVLAFVCFIAPSFAEMPANELTSPEAELALIQTGVEAERGPTGRRPTLPANKQPKDKLDVALAAIKQDIMVRNRQLEEEKKWVAEVRKVIEQYNKKVNRVTTDIKKTRSEVRELFKKKKQIENLKIQRQLESKLKDATSDLATLQQALHHVKSKASEFDKTKQEIKKTIYNIHTQLAKLKGEKPKVKAPTDI
jgi:chromosome segregation ATPase